MRRGLGRHARPLHGSGCAMQPLAHAASPTTRSARCPPAHLCAHTHLALGFCFLPAGLRPDLDRHVCASASGAAQAWQGGPPVPPGELHSQRVCQGEGSLPACLLAWVQGLVHGLASPLLPAGVLPGGLWAGSMLPHVYLLLTERKPRFEQRPKAQTSESVCVPGRRAAPTCPPVAGAAGSRGPAARCARAARPPALVLALHAALAGRRVGRRGGVLL